MNVIDLPEGWYITPLGDRSNWTGQNCYMCDQPHTSHEHMPPKNLFAGATCKYPFLTVPACDLHNEPNSADDEHFRSLIAAHCSADSTEAKHLVETKIARAVVRNPKMAKEDYNQTEAYEIHTPSGLYVETRHIPFSFSPKERACMMRVYCRLSFAIYYHLSQQSVKDKRFKLLDLTLPWEKDFVDMIYKPLQASPNLTSGNPDIFQYKAIGLDANIDFMVIWTCFFKKLSMVSIVAPV